MKATFRPYRRTDYPACVGIFDSNCPEFLAPGERQEYQRFLDDLPEVGYEICEVDGRVLGAFGLLCDGTEEKRINWLMVDSNMHGMGLGSMIMARVIHLGRTAEMKTVGFDTSQKVAPFFEKYGAQSTSVTKDGYGPGLDQVEMVLAL